MREIKANTTINYRYVLRVNRKPNGRPLKVQKVSKNEVLGPGRSLEFRDTVNPQESAIYLRVLGCFESTGVCVN